MIHIIDVIKCRCEGTIIKEVLKCINMCACVFIFGLLIPVCSSENRELVQGFEERNL